MTDETSIKVDDYDYLQTCAKELINPDRIATLEAEVERLREAIDEADKEAAEAEEILEKGRNSRCAAALLCIYRARANLAAIDAHLAGEPGQGDEA